MSSSSIEQWSTAIQTEPPPKPQPPPPAQWPPIRPGPNLPNMTLVQGSRGEYFKIGVPLYEASIKCNWKAAKAILDNNIELVRYSITENGETPLHVAASAKSDLKRVEEFVKKLVEFMDDKDLELQNRNYNTAFYQAAAAGNVETMKIMLKVNKKLLTIPGANKTMMPLHAAALFGNKEVFEFIYDESISLLEEYGWTRNSRGWLIEKLVENNMFDTALKIVEKYPLQDDTIKTLLKLLAGKPEVFHETKSTAIKSVLASFGLKTETLEKESKGLQLLRFVWGDVVTKPIREIDAILRGPPDSYTQHNKTSERAVKVMKLEKIISDHLETMKTEILENTYPVDETQKIISRSLVNMHDETQKIFKSPSNSSMQGKKQDSSKDLLLLELQNLISKHISEMHNKVSNVKHNSQIAEDQFVSELQNCILEYTRILRSRTQDLVRTFDRETYSSGFVFIAAEMGNTRFLVELIHGYPDIIWKVNDNNQSMFHVAVKYRREGIYNLLYEIGAMKDLITPLRDQNGNNMLHLAGMCTTEERLAEVSGVALQMQLELSWFHEVKKILPPSYRDQLNGDGLTADELFTREHKNLVALGEKWMKETASQCMVVATLITTIVFAATFVIPGGYDQTSGIPVFHSRATFVVFMIANAISLISSTTSILMFLSILTSRYAQYDFLESLPRKLMFGLATLFLSITTMMLAFGVSFFILYLNGLLWMSILVCVLVVLPAILYIRLQYGLFSDVIYSIHRSRYMFKPHKPVINYENPKV